MLFFLCSLVILITLWYFQYYRYWSVRKIKNDLPMPVIGNHFKNMFGMRTDAEMGLEMYKKYPNERIVGYYRGKTPVLIIRDPDIIKYILTKDFLHFYGRGLGREHEKSLMLNVFHSQGDRWQLLRHAISAAFTTSKLRAMFPLIKQCTERLQILAKKFSALGDGIDAHELMARYTTEFIGACGFGINMNTINTEKSLFLELGKNIFSKSKWQTLIIVLRELFPNNSVLKNCTVVREDTRVMITNIINILRKDRLQNTIKRNDFFELLLKLEKQKHIHGESLTRKDEKGLPFKTELIFSEIYAAAQLFIFFAGGFETSATTSSWTLRQLAYNPDVQRKVQNEIDRTLKKYSEISYDAISEMSYLEMTIKESMRTFSASGYISRECMKKYLIPGTRVSIDPGVIINIPVQALHLDDKYYDSPSQFRPERFLPEEERKRHKYVYLPFGEGPRKCIGSRLGLMESMTGLVALLQYFNVEPAPSSRQDYVTKRSSFIVQAVKGGIPIILKPRNTLEF